MKYTVDWSPSALAALATIWMSVTDRQAVTDAQFRIDHLLAADPLQHRFPVGEGLYGIEVDPLRAVFEMDAHRLVVRVVGVSLLV